MKEKFTGKNQHGFTLIEVLVVLIILGLLIGIVGPKVIGHSDEAKVKTARIQIEGLSSALKMYKLDNGKYPSTEQGLEALVTQPQTGDIPRKWRKGGYLEGKVPQDPWGGEYLYLYPGAHGDFDIMSYGADGVAGGEDYDKDVTNWESE
jgi:general secretion pathway protein G